MCEQLAQSHNLYTCLLHVACCRHGAHNWEGPGALTALTALRSLARLTAAHSWLQHMSSPDFVVFAGQFVGHVRMCIIYTDDTTKLLSDSCRTNHL